MTRDRHRPNSARLDHAYRHTGRSETHRAAPAPHRQAPSTRVPGALSECLPDNNKLLGKTAVLSTEIIDITHGIGLSVLWTELSVRWRSQHPR